MKVESWSILQYFWPALSDNRSWKPILVIFWSGRLRQVLLYSKLVGQIILVCLWVRHSCHVKQIVHIKNQALINYLLES